MRKQYKTIVGDYSQKRSEGYDPPNLFPDAKGFVREDDSLFDYIESKLIEIARDGKLCLTDIFNQPYRERQVAFMILHGHYWDGHGRDRKQQVDYNRIPPELLDCVIKIRSIHGKPIVWKSGTTRGRRVGGFRDGRTIQFPQPVFKDAETTEGEFNIHDAWLILAQAGKFCKYAGSDGMKTRVWQYEEIRPDMLEQETPEPTTKSKSTQRRLKHQEAAA